MTRLDVERYLPVVNGAPAGRFTGHVTRVVGLTIECRGIQVALGELCHIHERGRSVPLGAQVVGFRDGATLLMPIGEAGSLAPGAAVEPTGRRLSVSCSDAMLGRVLDALGRPMDGKGPLRPGNDYELHRSPPNPLERANIDSPLETGVSAIDGPLTLGLGQRMGIFAGSGVGKSTLMGNIARDSFADVNVIALIGERGREVKEFIDHILGPEGLARSVVVVATSDSPPLMRLEGAFTATAIAESFRDRGQHVMLMMDSVTRLANATREIGLAVGEPPTVKGYPPSFFSTMPKLVERMGRMPHGSITGFLTVLVDADDMNEPVADTMRGLLDGHIVLSRKIAARGHFPAIDVLHSASRVMGSVVSDEHNAAAQTLRRQLATYEDARDLISVGAYKSGSDARIDAAVELQPQINALLAQGSGERRTLEETRTVLKAIHDATLAREARGA